ncbi:uncharacterized protein [Miscanthus floridulus]|uniref:uncharacterized protein isoform X2 n=1 Tax=Miscanthus floridulus TaxID=154761 RepID=UPI00345A6FCB
MGDTLDQEMLDVKSAGDGELQVGPGFPASRCSPAIGKLGICDAAANQEAPVKDVEMAEDQPPAGLLYTVDDHRSSFTEFIKDLRVILADHQDREDICDRHVDPNISSSRKHPLLPKPCAEQPVRWIRIKLQLQVEGEESLSSATLLMRDDNVDVIGFINQSGVCYDFADRKRSARRILPQEYKPVLLGWGNSYKSILGVRKEEEVMDRLTSANLGKTFATHAVRLLSRYPHEVDGIEMTPMLALVGLKFMVSESARMNPVRNAIARGWDTGTGFTKQLMTDYVWKYVEMSRRLRHWKRGNYAERRPDSELRDIYLVLNVHAELVYTIGDEISFISFMTDLRRKLAEHPEAEDILGGHKDPNLSKTGDHPVLAKQRADEQPARWIHVTLQAVEGEETSWITLFMRDDNVYVLGFMNQQGDSFQLLDDNRNAATNILLPITNGRDPELSRWGVSYMSMLGAKSNDHAVHKLEAAHLGRDFAKNAVRVLSSHPNPVAGIDLSPRVALAGLIVMVCESARMNPPHDSFSRGWSTGTGFAKQLMTENVWEHGKMSSKLMAWKTRGYASNVSTHNWQPHPIMELQTLYLVLNNTHTSDQAKKVEKKKNQRGKPGNVNNDGDSINKPGNTGSGRGPPGQSRGGHNTKGCGGPPSQSGGGRERKRGFNNGRNGSPQIQHNKACNIGIGGISASKSSEEASDAGSNGSRDSKSEEASDADSGSGPASQADEAGDDTSSSGGDSSSQPGEAGDGDSSGGSASQPGEAGDNGDLDLRCQGHGRPRVELLAIHADLHVKGTEIVVFDGRRGQIIYRKEEGEEETEQGMVELVLTGPYKGISAYGCFAIKINIPPANASGSSGDAGGLIQWEWDCYDPKYAAQVDQLPVSHTICAPDMRPEVAEVTYVVMSDALEATVQVRLRLKAGHNTAGIGGEITARIDGFEDKYRSVLFRCAKGTRQCFSPTDDDSWFLLELARNVVAVPCGSALQIEVNLQIETGDGKKVELNNVPLRFANGISSSKTDDGNEVEVEVTWYPEIARPISHPPEQIITSKEAHMEKSITAPSPLEQIITGRPEAKMVSGHQTVEYTIGDELSFTEFIMALRGILADHPDREDIFDGHHSSILSSTREHPVLAKQRAEQPARWIHVKLQAVKGEQTMSTTLIMRDDNLYVCGFMNQQGDSFELIENLDRSADILPVDEYNPQCLSWGVGYRSFLDFDTKGGLVRILEHVNRGQDFVMDAVHVLSCFPAWVDDRISPRLALVGLILIVCESARMNPIYNFFTSSWSREYYTVFSDRKTWDLMMRGYVLNLNKYGMMSRQLLAWKSRRYPNPHPISPLQHIYLVLNHRLDPPRQEADGAWLPPRVELLAMQADLGVLGTTVIVFDGKRGHIIYRKQEQGEEGTMADLVLTGPCTSILAYGCFAIKIDIPGPNTSTGDGGGGGSIKWEWDCYDPEYAREVDKGPMTRTISSSGPGRNVEITYAVMSNAVEATVQVKLRMKDGNSPCSVYGVITASIGYFKGQSILFRRTKETAQHLSPMTNSPQGVLYQLVRSLELARNVVAVTRGVWLNIGVDLSIETSKNQVENKSILYFHNHSSWSSQRCEVDGYEVEVNVAWYPGEYVPRPWDDDWVGDIFLMQTPADISYMVGNDAEGFSTFIIELRRLVTDHPRCRDLVADHPDLSSTSNNKVLRKVEDPDTRRIQPESLFHIKLEAEAEEGVEETSSIILVMRCDNLDVIGFINMQDRRAFCYEPGSRVELPGEYRSKPLHWWDYGRDREQILGPAWLGKTFMAEAVRELSRFTGTDDHGFTGSEEAKWSRSRFTGSEEAVRSLVSLMIMVCDSARMEPVREAMAGGWKYGTELTEQLNNYRGNWPVISRALLDWRDHAYQGWPENTKLKWIGITSPEDALKVVPLVFNDPDRI